MAFSHRPTWHAARGAGSTFDVRNYITGGVPSRQIQEQDLPNHTFLKFRKPTQGTEGEVSTRDLKKELELKEIAYFEKTNQVPKNYGRIKAVSDKSSDDTRLLLDGKQDENQSQQGTGAEEKGERKPLIIGGVDMSALNKYDDIDADDDISEDDSSDSGSDDDDEEAELMRELEKIKREREEERKRKEEQDLILQAKLKQSEQIGATSISNLKSSRMKVKRRWDEDVVFRNQATTEPKLKKRFINDTIRNDFHRRFLNKYIK